MQQRSERSWQAEDAFKAGQEALTILGESKRALKLLRFGENAIYHVVGTDVVLRVARPSTPSEDIARTIEAANLLRLAGIPVAEPAAHLHADQPIILEGGIVSVWKFYTTSDHAQIDFGEFGRLLRNLHTNSGSSVQGLLPRWEPMRITRERIRTAERTSAPSPWTRSLSDRCDELETQLLTFRPVLDIGVVHGDAHSGNLLVTNNGLVLIDLDNLSIGPRDIDLVPTMVQFRRFNVSTEQWQDLTLSYGLLDGSALADSPLVALRELFMVAWLLQQHGSSREVDKQINLRIASLRDGADSITSWAIR